MPLTQMLPFAVNVTYEESQSNSLDIEEEDQERTTVCTVDATLIQFVIKASYVCTTEVVKLLADAWVRGTGELG